MEIKHVTRNVSTVHFLLMFGYKMFSLYFPLFLVAKHFSIPQVGYATFFIYLPIALLAPVVGYLNHKIHSSFLAALGIFGYGIYTLGMIFASQVNTFYILQVILGISAALFFVSVRTMLMQPNEQNQDRSFAWFYVAPSYADAIAPAVGGLIIWKFGFTGVFIASLVVYLFAIAYCLIKFSEKDNSLRGAKGELPSSKNPNAKEILHNYGHVVGHLKSKHIAGYMAICFLLLMVAGFTNTFFVLFLKDLGWTQNNIIVFNSLISLALLPISFRVIKLIGQNNSEKNISWGSSIVGILYIIIGIMANALNFYLAFFIMLGNSVGELMIGSGRSGLMATKLKEYPEESAAVDTMFSPLARAVASAAGGLLIASLGYPLIFIGSGAVALFAGLAIFRIKSN